MSDLICRKTMMRCQTPGMCSPFGGCRDGSYERPAMANDVKRYDIEDGIRGVEVNEREDGNFVLATDHDAIVAELQAKAERELSMVLSSASEVERIAGELQVERDQLAERCRKLQAQVEQLTAESAAYAKNLRGKHEVAGATYEHLIAERDTLRAEVERLRKTSELEREMQRAASELPDGWEIRVCVERSAGWVELTNPDGEGIADTWSGQESLSCEVSDAIDAALEASR